MANKCEVKDCNYLAASGETKCLQHKTRVVPKAPSADTEGYTFVPMSDVPTNARYNEEAGKLFAAVKASEIGQALKVSLNLYKKPTLITAQRYALESGTRIGVRIVGETGYLWKLNDQEIKAAQAKGERLSLGRQKKASRAARA